jgi:hypothetical protein
MTRLTTEQRHEIPDREFACIQKDGKRLLPIENAEHVRDALARWPVTEFESEQCKEEARKKILAAARKFGVAVSPTDKIVLNEHD